MRPAQPPQPPGPGIRRTGLRRHVGMPPYGRTEVGTVKRTALDPGASGPMWASAPTVGRTGGAWWGSNLVPGGYIIRPYRQACKFTVGAHCICALPSRRNHQGQEYDAPGSGGMWACRPTPTAAIRVPCTRRLADAPCAPLRAKRTSSLFPITSSARSRALPGPGGGRRASGRGSRRCW